MDHSRFAKQMLQVLRTGETLPIYLNQSSTLERANCFVNPCKLYPTIHLIPAVRSAFGARQKRFVNVLPQPATCVVKGLHFIQEDNPNEIGQAINNRLEQGQC
jgi:hypothetical protein